MSRRFARSPASAGVVTLLDNTWATPLFFPAIAAGVDISHPRRHQICRRACRRDDRRGHRQRSNIYCSSQRTSWDLGHALSPDDAWLGSRGLRTMAVRLKQHEESALRIAHWVKGRPEVGRVLHPAFPDCPGHELWKRDFKGSSGLFAFELDGDRPQPSSIASNCSASALAGAAMKASLFPPTPSAPSPNARPKAWCVCTSASRTRTT